MTAAGALPKGAAGPAGLSAAPRTPARGRPARSTSEDTEVFPRISTDDTVVFPALTGELAHPTLSPKPDAPVAPDAPNREARRQLALGAFDDQPLAEPKAPGPDGHRDREDAARGRHRTGGHRRLRSGNRAPARHRQPESRRWPRTWPARTWATLTFAAVEVAGLATYLTLGRGMWFSGVEWDYLAAVDPLDDPASLVRPHDGQWQTIPIVVYRLVWQFTGLRTYWPYLVLAALAYLLTCALVYALMLRAHVRPWIALLAAAPLVFLGAAAENAVFGARIAYFGSLAFGLGQLLIITGRRARSLRVLGIGFGIAALMCSEVGIVMLVVVTAEALLRRGWRAALAVSLPPVAVLLTWWAIVGDSSWSGVPGTLRFTWTGLRAAGVELSRHGDPGAAVVGALLVAGLLTALLSRRGLPAAANDGLLAGRVAWMRITVPLAIGALGFLLLTGAGRAGEAGAGEAAAPRYSGVVVALLLPVAAVAADTLWTRLKPAGLLALAVLAVGIPGNLSAITHGISSRAEQVGHARSLVLGVGHLPSGVRAPDDQRPFPEPQLAPALTMRFVRQADVSGWLPQSGPPAPPIRAADEFRLAIYQTSTTAPARDCEPIADGKDVSVRVGDRLRIAGGTVQVTNRSPGPQQGQRVSYEPARGDVLEIRAGQYRLRLTGQDGDTPARLCAR